MDAERDLAQGLAGVALFRGLDREELDRLAAIGQVGRLQAGGVIVSQNQSGDGVALYVVLGGRVRVVRRSRQGVERDLATIGPGGWFGESGLFRDRPRSASVIALEPTTCVTFRRWGFEDELLRHPRIALRMLEAVLDKLSATNRLL